MAYGHCQGIRGVFLGNLRKIQEHLDHFLDLFLGRFAIADYCLLYLQGRVFEDRQSGIDSGDDCCATGLAKFQCALYIVGKENILNCHRVRLVLPDYLSQPAVYFFKAEGEIFGRIGENGAVVQMDEAIALFADDAVAGNA